MIERGEPMNDQPRKRLTLLALLMGALALSGCGAKKTARNTAGLYEAGSRMALADGAYCNTFSSSEIKLNGKIQTYLNPDGSEVADFMRLRITGIDERFATNTKYVMRFFRAEAFGSPVDGADNTINFDPTPVNVRFEGDAGLMISGYMDDVSMTDVSEMRRTYALPGSTASDFFNRVDIIVSDVDLRWDVLIITIDERQTDGGLARIGEARMLMPSFAADPKIYAADHPLVLHPLHPFWNQRASTAADFAAMSDSFCW